MDKLTLRGSTSSPIFSWFLYSAKESKNKNIDDNTAIMPIYREGAFRYISLSIALVLTPFLLLNLINGRWLLAIVESVFFFIILLHCWRLFRYNKPIISPAVLVGLAALLICGSFFYNRSTNIYWAPSIIIAFHFILERRSALLFNIVFFCVLIPITFLLLAADHAVIFLLSLLLTSISAIIFSDIVYRQEQKLQLAAISDPLTGAFNRRHMMNSLERAIASRERYQTPCAAILFDIDFFKNVNDTRGHAEGDRALKIISTAIKQRLRKTDTLFRYGGEEFLILLTESNAVQAQKLAEEFCSLIRNTSIFPDQTITISCGVSEIVKHDGTQSVIIRCDNALYRAKSNGRDRVELGC